MKRRAFLRNVAAFAATAAVAVPVAAEPATFTSLERHGGGRLGIAALDTGTGRVVEYRAQERFPMCSTFKLVLAAAVLRNVQSGTESLSRRVRYTRHDLVAHSPVTAAHIRNGSMTIAALCAAAIEESDNAAANILLKCIGGPAALTAFVRSFGDRTTRFDRIEPFLNTSVPGDPRDTSTPAAMVRTLQKILVGDVLEQSGREHLRTWLQTGTLGDHRLRRGLPRSWRFGDKTGTGDNGSTNDVGIAERPGAAPLIVVAYYTGSRRPPAEREAVLAQAAALLTKS